eukprot:TRINITY_DN25330_c0_g1_i1.p1 TRINITY_DN25330_c0_g1~~TRINITY_DN25330_c0_g1_i1.p1  ORF type:complete len:502 (-),score=45.94 TRINITY_DN25330_c0_g1_i1:121-1626(-)
MTRVLLFLLLTAALQCSATTDAVAEFESEPLFPDSAPYWHERCRQFPACPCQSQIPAAASIQFVVLTSNGTAYRTALNCWPILARHVLYVSDTSLPHFHVSTPAPYPSTSSAEAPQDAKPFSAKAPHAAKVDPYAHVRVKVITAPIHARMLLSLYALQREGLPPGVRWVFVVDDDTYPFVSNLARLVVRLDPRKAAYLGATSEARLANIVFGRMAFGGGGILLSRHLLEKLAPRLPWCTRHRRLPGVPQDPPVLHTCSDKRLAWCLTTSMPGVPLTLEPGMHQVDLSGDARGFLEAEVSRHRVYSLHHLEDLELQVGAPTALHNFAWLHAVATRSGDQRALFRRVMWRLEPFGVWVDLTYGYNLKLWPPQKFCPVSQRQLHVAEATFITRFGAVATDKLFEFPVRRPDHPCSRLVLIREQPEQPWSPHVYANYLLSRNCNACQALCSALGRAFGKVPKRVQVTLGSCPEPEPICEARMEDTTLMLVADILTLRFHGMKRSK